MPSPRPSGSRSHPRPEAPAEEWTVAAVRRHPVKSMGGERVDAATLGVRGVAGDRRWAVVDAESSAALSAKRHPQLLHCRARLVTAPHGDRPAVEVTLPDGAVVRSGEPDRAATLLTALLGRRVRLAAAGRDRVHSEFPDEDAPDEDAPDDGNPDDGPNGARVVRGLRGMFADGAPVHLLTTGMLAAAAPDDAAPDDAAPNDAGRAAVARYRPNIVLSRPPGRGVDGDTGARDAEESRWLGRRVQVGGALLEITVGCPRCTMIGMSQPGVAADRSLLRDIVERRGAVVGLYGKVLTPGDVAVGDAATVVDGTVAEEAGVGGGAATGGDGP